MRALAALVVAAAFGLTVRALRRRAWELRRAIEIMDDQHRRTMAEIMARRSPYTYLRDEGPRDE